MSVSNKTTDDLRWQVVVQRDPNGDGDFVFAVSTTGIFCRPSCRSRRPLRKNVRFFTDAASALAAGFRPCKRCQPIGPTLQQRQRDLIADACRLLAASERPIGLKTLAERMAVSPWHFQRLFKKVTGVTPRAWYQAQRATRLRTALRQNSTVTDAVYDAGYNSASSYYRQADRTLGMTASQYRNRGAETVIHYVYGHCQLGHVIVAASERGVCAVLPGDNPGQLREELAAMFPRAQLTEAGEGSSLVNALAAVLDYLDVPDGTFPLPLDLQGTLFQQRVWQALCTIPPGETASYRDIACKIGQPDAFRAVAGACGANRLALVIPCHRIIRQDGTLSGYRWGQDRKRLLLARENALPKPGK